MKKVLENEPYEMVRNRISNQTLPEVFADKYTPFKAGTGQTKAGLTQPDVEYTLHAVMSTVLLKCKMHKNNTNAFSVASWCPRARPQLKSASAEQSRAQNGTYNLYCVVSTEGLYTSEHEVTMRTMYVITSYTTDAQEGTTKYEELRYALARAMAPRKVKNGGPILNKGVTSTRTNFLHLFTILVAKPQLYHEYITEWEQDMGETFTPIPTDADVQMFIKADDKQLHQLAEYGEPPAIQAWDGWYIPSEHDKLYIRHLLDDKRQKKKIDSLIDSDWLFIGEEVLPIYLHHHNARQAAHVYKDELNRLSALHHTEAVVHKEPPTPQEETGASNIATGSNAEDMTMGNKENNSSIIESSGCNRPKEIPSDIRGEPDNAEM
ncbi:hypothetical protein BD779DRAFT_1478269 [Infundibulicybe gibba]|nr:hypothetical protein BD779DRAFT_1478269 [Infundibulicybe gibba]